MLNNLMSESMKFLANLTQKTYRQYPKHLTALVLVDVQKEFLLPVESGWQSVSDVAETVNFKKNMSSLIAFARAQGYDILYAPYTDTIKPTFETPAHQLMKDHIQVRGNEVKVAPNLLEQSILPNDKDTIIEDRTGLSAFSGSSLHQKLQDKNIENLIFAGPFINIGLDSSIRDAVEYGYHATLVTDCAAATSNIEYEMAKDTTIPRFCQTLFSNSLFQTKAAK
ncbi:MAG: isochorismatase family cysteine hydrolase [Bermanella sp.]